MFAQQLHEKMKLIVSTVPFNPLDRVSFLRNLMFMHQVMRASEQLLVLAITQSEPGSRVKAFFEQHLEEEKGHDRWLFNDLARAGQVPPAWIAGAAQFTGAQYYHVIHNHPIILLGYMLLLEGFPLTIPAVELLEEIHGVEVCRTIRHHAVHDAEHCVQLMDFINSLGDSEKAIIEATAIETTKFFVKTITEYLEH